MFFGDRAPPLSQGLDPALHLSKEESKLMRFLDEVTLHASIQKSRYVTLPW